MPVEINYFAWEQDPKIFHSSILGFVRSSPNFRLISGICVGHIFYRQNGWHPWVSYEFFAEDENSPITKLARIAVDSRILFAWEEVDLNMETSQQIDRWLSELPYPEPTYTEYLAGSIRGHWAEYSVQLGSKHDYLSFSMSVISSDHRFKSYGDSKCFYENLHHIIEKCEELTGNKSHYRDKVEVMFEPYHKLFRKKIKHAKYQGKWSAPALPDYPQLSDKYYYTDLDLLRTFKNENLSDDWKRQLDFKFYLSGFMRLLALHNDENKLGAELIFQKIGETDFPNWDEDEQEALHNYFRALWEYVLTYYPSLGIDAYTFIHGVGLAGADVTPYIEHWKQEFHRVEVSRHLAGYIQVLFEQYVQRGEVIFDEVPKILRRWLKEVAMGSYFLKRFVEYDGVRPFAVEFADASEALDVLCDAGL